MSKIKKVKDMPSSPFVINNKIGRFCIYFLLVIGVIQQIIIYGDEVEMIVIIIYDIL